MDAVTKDAVTTLAQSAPQSAPPPSSSASVKRPNASSHDRREKSSWLVVLVAPHRPHLSVLIPPHMPRRSQMRRARRVLRSTKVLALVALVALVSANALPHQPWPGTSLDNQEPVAADISNHSSQETAVPDTAASADGPPAGTGTNPSDQLTAAASGEPPGPVPEGPATDVVGTRNVTWKELRQPCNGSELISWARCHGPDCAKVFPGATASPPPASPTPPAVIIQSTAGSAAVQVEAAAAGDSTATPADGAPSPPEASEGLQLSTGPATNDQLQEQPGAAAPAPAVAPPAPGITSAPPPPTADRWPVPFCQCQQLCADVKSGLYGRNANTSCRADSQHPNRWFIKLRGRTRVMCHNPVMPEIQAQKPNKGKPVKPPPKKKP